MYSRPWLRPGLLKIHIGTVRIKPTPSSFQYHTEVAYSIEWQNFKEIFVFSSCKEFCINFCFFWLNNSWTCWPFFLFLFFKCSLNFKAHALKFDLNKAVRSTFMKFKYGSPNPLNWFSFERKKHTIFLVFSLPNPI